MPAVLPVSRQTFTMLSSSKPASTTQAGPLAASEKAFSRVSSVHQRRCRPLVAASTRRSLLQAAPLALVCSAAAGHGRGDLRASAVEAAVQCEMSTTIQVASIQQEKVIPEVRAPTGPPAFVKATGRIIAIGDIHGDLQKALSCLELAGVLAEDDGHVRWVGGDTTVVQLGDVLDRGDSEISTVLLLRELDKQARKEGGAVWMLNGNHESLNVAGDFRYVTPGAFWESAIAAGMTETEIASDRQAVLRARWHLYRPGGQMARELAKNPTVLVVNDIVFAHGGLLPHHNKYGLQRINDEVAEWMNGAHCSDGSAPTPPFPAMGDANSVMWNRTFGKERASPYDRLQMGLQLDATLRQLNATAMVVGHTPQMGGLNTECNGRVWRVDVGMSSGVLNADPQVLEFSRNSQGQLMAKMLCARSNGAVEASSFVYEPQQPKNATGATAPAA
jgi:Calcineurin-like phosphoesterase